jgi:hypothetical protein
MRSRTSTENAQNVIHSCISKNTKQSKLPIKKMLQNIDEKSTAIDDGDSEAEEVAENGEEKTDSEDNEEIGGITPPEE